MPRRCGGYRRVSPYTADGYLAQVSQAVGEWDADGGSDGAGGVVLGAAVRHAHDRRDAMGRVVERLEMEKDASVPQVSRILDDADAAKHGATGPQVQPGSLDDGFMDLKLDTDSVGHRSSPACSTI